MTRIKVKQSNGDLRRQSQRLMMVFAEIALALGFKQMPSPTELVSAVKGLVADASEPDEVDGQTRRERAL